MKISDRQTKILVFILLLIMFFTSILSVKDEALTFDELSHIPAGYSYLSQRDFRINPEHPPLIKDISAVPLLFMDLNFPEDHPSWENEVNSQWWFGNQFIFKSGNDADMITFWAKMPMILVLMFLGWFLFIFTRKFFGNKVALMTLFIFSFSPTFIAHGRLVTTDIGAALGVIMTTYFWLEFLKNPNRKNIVLAGIFFGISMLFKFSMALLIPFLAIIVLAYALIKNPFKNKLKSTLKYLSFSVLAGVIALVFIIWPVYQFHVSNYPPEKQLSDTQEILASSPAKSLSSFCVWMADKPVLRSVGHYFFGLLMATQRTSFGNTVYFMDSVSGTGWWHYFPTVYFLKIPLAFHILSLISLLFLLFSIRRRFWYNIKEWISDHFVEFSMVVFLAIYWSTSMIGSLNIGVRHVIPTFPFIYILVSLGIVRLSEKIKKPSFKKVFSFLIFFLLFWYASSSLNCFPYYISYFNEVSGGCMEGYKYVVDSSFDWGQDLKRLSNFVEENNIEKIKIDYFGGSDIEYYLGDKFEKFDPKSGPQKGWLAISATLLQGGRAEPAKGFDQDTRYYEWLNDYEPVGRAGSSIFIYNIED
jgi:hypothetical protein